MRVGKLPQTVWRRSVLKQLNCPADQTCTVVRGENGEVILAASASVSGNTYSAGMYAAVKAVNDLASRGAVPAGLSMHLALPVRLEEEGLKEIIRRTEAVCRSMQVPLTGVQAEVHPAVCQIIIHAEAIGTVKESELLSPGAVHPGQEIVLCGYVGLEGMLRILDECEEELSERFAPAFIRSMKALREQIVQVCSLQAAQGCRVAAMQQIGSGGIFGALWELAEAAGVGLEADLAKMSIRQETVEVCEYFRLNPYQMTSAGCILMVTDHGAGLVRELCAGGTRAAVLGITTAESARVIINGSERRFLDRPAPDELMLWWERRLRGN